MQFIINVRNVGILTDQMQKFSYIIYIVLQCTWGFFQTMSGLVYFLISLKYPHEFYHGSILTRRSGIGGVSLGLFIFANDDRRNGKSDKIAAHEYGHTIQSLILGPLYLPIIGLISFTWCGLPFFVKLRKRKHISYYSCFTESWANRLGSKVLHEEVPYE